MSVIGWIIASRMTLQTKAGTLVIRKVRCEVVEDGEDEVLIGKSMMEKLGIDVDRLLAEKCATVDADAIVYKGETMEDTATVDEPAADSIQVDLDPTISAIDEEILAELEKRLQEAVTEGLPIEWEDSFRNLLVRYKDVFRVRLGKDPPVKVPPMKVHRKDARKPF